MKTAQDEVFFIAVRQAEQIISKKCQIKSEVLPF